MTASTVPAVRAPRLPRWSLVAAILTVAFFVLAAMAPGLVAPADPDETNLDRTLAAPSPQHWFGTDEIGRDLFTRVIHGAGDSLTIGVGAAAVSLTLALVLASAATLTPRFVAGAADRLIEILFAFPTLLLALLLVAVLGPSSATLVFAVGVGCAPGYARMIRAQMLSARNSGYVEAAVALGHSRAAIIGRHIVPNALRPLVAVFTLSIGQCVVWASSLAFLGLGIAPPASEWGALLDAGRTYLTAASWLVVIPGLFIVVLALAATTIGKAIQQQLERGE